MREQATTIDLGELPSGQYGQSGTADLPPRPWPGWNRLGRGAHRPVRWVAAIVVGMVLAAGVAAAPERSWAVPHLTVPHSGLDPGAVVVAGDSLYAIAMDGAVAAYRLADGTVRWQAPVPQAVDHTHQEFASLLPVQLENGRLLLTGPAHAADGTVRSRTFALDAATGDLRWDRAGMPRPLPGGRIALLDNQRRPGDGPGREPGATRVSVSVVDTAGAEQWRLPATDLVAYQVSTRPDPWLVTLTPDGLLRSYDLTTGAPAAETELPAPAAAPWLTLLPGLVLVQSPPAREWRQTEGTSYQAYEVDTMERRWQGEAPPDTMFVASCGTMACVLRPDQVDVLDPATGQLEWSSSDLPETDPASGSANFPLDTGYWETGHTLIDGWLVQVETGEPVLDLADWGVQHHLPSGVNPPPAVLQQYDSDYAGGDGGVWFGRVQLDPPRLEVLGAVPGPEHGCQLWEKYITCVSQHEIQIWRR